jgi:hypothetical protein
MKKWSSFARGLGLAFLVVLAMSGTTSAQDNTRETRWAEQVLLGPEFGGSGKFTARWVKAPSLSVFGGTPEHEKAVDAAVKDINRQLAATPVKGIRLLAANDASADIRVYFALLSEFPALGKKHAFTYVEGNWGFFWMFWNGKREIYKAYVLLASDKLQGNRLTHFALEEITQVLGPSNDSPLYADSIFYSKNGDGGNAQTLSERDRKLIRFLYNHVHPGADQAELRAAFKKHWANP